MSVGSAQCSLVLIKSGAQDHFACSLSALTMMVMVNVVSLAGYPHGVCLKLLLEPRLFLFQIIQMLHNVVPGKNTRKYHLLSLFLTHWNMAWDATSLLKHKYCRCSISANVDVIFSLYWKKTSYKDDP